MKTRTLAAALLLPCLALAPTACGSDNPGGIVLDGGEGGDFDIQISADDPPAYDWPEPGGLRLVVERVTDGQTLWRVVASDPDVGFTPPVTHGINPVGGVEEVEQGVLVAGEEYRIRLTRIDGASSTRTFSP